MFAKRRPTTYNVKAFEKETESFVLGVVCPFFKQDAVAFNGVEEETYLRTVGTKARGVEGSRGRGGRAATQRFCATSAKCCWLSQPNTKKKPRLSYSLF